MTSRSVLTIRITVDLSYTEGGTTTDHAHIRRWVEERGGKPALSPDGKLLIQFGDNSQNKQVEWENFFEIFESGNFVFVYQEKLPDGTISSFFKLRER